MRGRPAGGVGIEGAALDADAGNVADLAAAGACALTLPARLHASTATANATRNKAGVGDGWGMAPRQNVSRPAD